jgi:hypothetical protein
MIVKFELSVSGNGDEHSFWMHRGTLVLPDTTSDHKVIRSVKKAMKLPKGCFHVEKTTNGWTIQPWHMVANGTITVAM